MKFSIKDFFSKCDQIRRKLQILSHLLKKSLMENFIYYPEVYLGPCHTTIMELYAKTVSSEKTLFIFSQKISIIFVCPGPTYPSPSSKK